MKSIQTKLHQETPSLQVLMAYIANLELEVDRLRKQGQFIQQETIAVIRRIQLFCQEATQGANPLPHLGGIDHATRDFVSILRDLQESPGYHPAHDQVIAIAMRPLIEQVFRRQQRLVATPHSVLKLELEVDYVEWFPVRLRHILDNLISNALKYRDPQKSENWVQLSLRTSPSDYQLQISDNGIGLPSGANDQVFELIYRASAARETDLGVGLAVVKLLVEQSGGKLTVDSGVGQGSNFTVILPRYDISDFLI